MTRKIRPARSHRITGLAALRMMWDLLTPRERRMAAGVGAVMAFAALASAAMVVSIMPFLHVLTDVGVIQNNATMAMLRERGGFASDYDFVVALGIATVVFIFLVNMVLLASHYLLTRFSVMRIHSLAVRLLSAYLRQPYEFFLNRHSGEISKSVLSEVNQVVSGFLLSLGNLVAATMTSAAIMVALVWVSPGIALGGILVIGGAYALIYGGVRAYLARLGRQRVKANGQRFRIASEALTGAKEIKLAGREQSYIGRFSRPARTYARTQARARVIEGAPKYLLQAVLFGGIVLICLLMIDRASFEGGGALGGIVPVLGAFALGAQKLMPEVQKLFAALTKMRTTAPAVAHLHGDLVLAQGRPALPATPPAPLRMRATLAFDRVSYRYPGAELAGLSDVTLEIHRGERIGIVGATGAGKSTFADLVLGLLEPHSGVIAVDGVALSGATLRAWQAGIGYVPQEIFLTDSSVAENIAFAIPPAEIDRARVEESARLAQIDAFIREELPQGYDTFVGERGVRLSGGQRQRLGIARALYRDAGLIVFDEATSALDNLTEREVMAAIDALPGDKTVLMIAHRLSTVRRCNRILVLDKGRVAGFGDWETLMQDCPAFRQMVDVARVA
ncbi:ABC transporter ATP-binding protein [Alkalilacustris brevis]|uniref:ABC transporter ATP-binding protein n=1 Tax=Alkalilacustris brevis TaxID=2026338 RepID=UPI000E0D8E20|nr:ABC transporter ATP-binding protein [Alkalilacustris brevis]